MAHPNISFIFPIRWLKPPDVNFLVKNLKRQINKGETKQYYHETITPQVSGYRCVLKIRSWQPIRFPMKKEDFQKALEEALPELRCVSLDVIFLQNDGPGGLPVMELELYF